MVVVGAGFAGMYMVYLARSRGLSVQCYEAGGDVGGTWYWNRYPGARVDIECLEYSYSFSDALQQEWQWSERYAGQPELLSYAQHVAERFDLRQNIQFDTRVTSACFNEESQRWVAETDHADVVEAKFCVMATGLISAPLEPDFPGLESFTGEQYQTARWPREKVEFAGKRVGVIGTGSSGIQLITEAAQEAGELYVFQRTPAYTIPLHNREVDPATTAAIKSDYKQLRKVQAESFGGFTLVHSALAPLPSKSALEVNSEERLNEYENRWASGGLSPYYAYTDVLLDEAANYTLSEFARDKMRERIADAETAESLIPKDYPILTRRLSPESNYLEVYNQANVSLVDLKKNPIVKFTETGLAVGDQEIALDLVVFATGFDVMTGAMDRIDIRGRQGQSLKQHWEKGLTSYLGMMTHGFPNLFWVNGPHSPFYNPILLAEYQCGWILDAIQGLGGRECLEASMEEESEWIQTTNSIGDMTLFPASNNYYMGDNIDGKPRQILFYFGGFPSYCEQCNQALKNLTSAEVSDAL